MYNVSRSGVSMSVMKDRLFVTIQGDLVQETLSVLRTDLLERTQVDRINAVIFDLSAVAVLDLTEFNMLHQTVLMIKLMGAETIFIGLNPGIVAFLVLAGADLSGMNTASDLDDVDRILTKLKNH